MLTRRHFTVLSSLAFPGICAAQTSWPSRPIRWIVNFPPAGAADILSRTLAKYYGSRLGQPIVVENKPGAGGMLGADIVAKALGDTHVVMMSSAASHGIGPVLYKDVPYDPLADFTHIRLVGQLLALSAKVPLTHIPYRGSAPAMNDLMGGQIVALMESLPTAIGYFNSGRMRPLAVSEAERSPSLPDVPALRESGFPDVVTTNWFGFSAAADIPPEIAKRWETDIATALQSAQVKEAFARIGVRPGTLGAVGYTDLIRSELARWKVVIRAGNIRAD